MSVGAAFVFGLITALALMFVGTGIERLSLRRKKIDMEYLMQEEKVLMLEKELEQIRSGKKENEHGEEYCGAI